LARVVRTFFPLAHPMTAIQAVYIRGHEERSTPKPHTVYTIEIQANVRSWQMWRRYSEFVDLNTELTKSTGAAPPQPLPPKHAFSLLRSHNDQKLLEERRAGLEVYLRSIVSAKDGRWRDSFAFRDFLGVPVGRQGGVQGGSPTHFTMSSWLDEHIELQTRIRDVRADINKRDALGDRGDVNGSQRANVDAKKKLAGVLSRIGKLGEGLRELAMGGMIEGELQRRTDMVARLQDDCEKLGKMVTIARMSSRGLGGPPSSATDTSPASASDREALLGAAPSGFNKPFARVFGSSAAQPKETEETRPLDDYGVFQLQKEQMEQQDTQVSQLTTILRRQRHLGEAIGQEISSQIELLQDLDNDVDKVGGKLTYAKGQLNRLG
jgi:regulator of vacuolar morphogenesis